MRTNSIDVLNEVELLKPQLLESQLVNTFQKIATAQQKNCIWSNQVKTGLASFEQLLCVGSCDIKTKKVKFII